MSVFERKRDDRDDGCIFFSAVALTAVFVLLTAWWGRRR